MATLLDTRLVNNNGYRPHIDLYPVIQSLSRISNLYALKIIYLLHKAVEHDASTDSLTLNIPLDPLYSYLSFPPKSDKISLLQHALQEICNSPVVSLRRDTTGQIQWTSTAWISNYTLSESASSLELLLPAQSPPLYHLLEALTPTRPESIISLSRAMVIWLYVVLTNASKYGDYWIIPYEELNRLMMLEDKNVYSTIRNYQYIPKQILGLMVNRAFKEEERAARLEKRAPQFVPMSFGSRGNLPTIRAKCELFVNACNLKAKLALAAIAFSFREEDSNGIFYQDTSHYEKNSTFIEGLQNSEVLSSIIITNN